MENILKASLGIREAQIHLLDSLIKGYKKHGFVPLDDLEQIRKDVIEGCGRAEIKEALNEMEEANPSSS